jgi:DNA uptake protein ComE-like DNA-binding protein
VRNVGNTKTISELRSFKIGIGPKTAPKIIENRSFSTLNEVQQKFGARRVLRWLRTYKQKY